MVKKTPVDDLKREILPYKNSPDLVIHVCLLLFYKFLSEDLESYIESSTDVKEYALKDKGYYIEPECYFSSLANSNHFIIRKLEDAYNQILISSMGYDGEKILNSIFRDVDFYDEGSDINEESVSKLVNIIDRIDFNESSVSELFEYLYGYGIYPPHRFSGNINNSNIYNLLAQIVSADKKHADSIYNPHVNGGFLLTNILQKCNISKVYGQEANLGKYKFDLMNLVINGADFKEIHIDQSNCITSPKFFNERFDVVLSEIPSSIIYDMNSKDRSFFTKLYDVEKFKRNLRRSEFPFIIHMLHQLKDDGVMAVLVRQNMLFRTFDEDIRECLINEKNYLDTVILLSGKLLRHSFDNFSILIFKKNRSSKDIFFIDASKDFDDKLTDENIEKIADAYASKKVIDKFSYLAGIDEIRENDYNLTVSRYIDTFEEDTVDLNDVLSKKLRLDKKLDGINEDIDYWLNELDLYD